MENALIRSLKDLKELIPTCASYTTEDLKTLQLCILYNWRNMTHIVYLVKSIPLIRNLDLMMYINLAICCNTTNTAYLFSEYTITAPLFQ